MKNIDRAKITSTRIKDLRLKKGYTIEKLADLIGVSKGTISKWENGYVDTIKQDKILLMAQTFGVSPSYILGYDVEADYIKQIRDVSSEADAERIRTLLLYYSELSSSDQDLIENMIKSLASKKE